ncbi:CE112 protein, partial [Sapayoa aenigma]|nr:CE112 protein [Sapayoa aenigma]
FKMNSEEETCEKLDMELDQYIVAIKPYVLRLRDDSERRVCAQWIKKLCRPSGAGKGIEGRENRNSYAKLLLHMLKRGVLDCPFSEKPEQGLLKSLPSYMLTYTGELSSPTIPSSNSDCLAEWLLAELGSSGATDESSSSTALTQGDENEKPSGISHSLDCPHRPEEDNRDASLSVRCFSFLLKVEMGENVSVCAWNCSLEQPCLLQGNARTISALPDLGQCVCQELQLCRLEMKMTIAEGKFYEEKLKLQQKHDADVQKILSRKNDEIETLKSTYRKKQKESEETIRKLEKKVQTVVRESQVVREAKEQQILELKKMCDKSNDALKNECEKRV